MIIPKILTLVIFRQLQIGAAAAPGAPRFRHSSEGRSTSLEVSQSMKAAKGWPPISSECGLHDYYSSVSTAPLDGIGDCSVKGDARASTKKLKQCLAECCASKKCIGITASSTGTMLVQRFAYAQQDNSADSYMVQVPHFALSSQVVEGISDSESKATVHEAIAESQITIGGHRVSTDMLHKRGFPPMSSQCGRHDFYGEIGSLPSSEIADCSRRGDIRKNYHSLQKCLEECCLHDSCIGISATMNGTKLIHSFEFITVDAHSNAYMLDNLGAKGGFALESKRGTHDAKGAISGKAVSKTRAVARSANSSNEKGTAISTNGASKHGVSGTDAPSALATCGKRYDFHGGMAAISSSVLGACSEKGDIRDNYIKIRRCFAECCATQNCVGITVNPTGAKLVQSFKHAEPDDDTDSFMLERIHESVLSARKIAANTIKIAANTTKIAANTTSEANASVSKVSNTMMDRRGFPSMRATCGRHDFFGKVGTSPSAVIGNCSATGDIRGDFQKLQMCLNQCCTTDACIGISATVNGTTFVQTFAFANVDNDTNSYMPHAMWMANLVETAAPAQGASNSSAKAIDPIKSRSKLSVKTTVPSKRGSKLSTKAAESSANTASKGEAETESQKGMEAAIESQQDAGFAKDTVTAGFANALSGEATSKSSDGTHVAAAADMTHAKSWPSVGAKCGKRYDFYGGIAGQASSALGNCSVKGDIRDNYSKLKICLQMCCKTAKCAGITASHTGTKLIESFSAVEMDEDQNSYMQH